MAAQALVELFDDGGELADGTRWDGQSTVLANASYFADCEREHGHCVASGEPKQVAVADAKAQSVLVKWGSAVSGLIDRVPLLGTVKRSVHAVMEKVRGKLAARYGDSAANVIMASGSIGGYGVMALAVRTVGFTLPIVTDVVSITAHVAVAEGLYQLGIIGRKGREPAAHAQVDAVEAWEEVAYALADLLRQHKPALEAALQGEAPIGNTAYAHLPDGAKVDAFDSWLVQQSSELGLASIGPWYELVKLGYEAGVKRACSAVDAAGEPRDELLARVFGGALERVRQLATDAHSQLVSVLKLVYQQASDAVAVGLARSDGAHDVARSVGKLVDAGLYAAQLCSRNAIVRAFVDGQLDAYSELGVSSVSLSVGRDGCGAYSDLVDLVVPLEEARSTDVGQSGCLCAWEPAGSLSGNMFCATGRGGGVDPSCSAGGDKAKFIGAVVGKAEKDHADVVEKHIAAKLGGTWEPDSKFYDVKLGEGPGPENASDFVEVKSLLKGGKTAISVHDDALLRKVVGSAEHPGSTYHTVAVDERATYGGGAFAGNYSGHRLYYKRGSGRYSLSKMHPVKDTAELKKLIAAPDAELPELARGTLPTGAAVKVLRVKAEKAHASRLAKDRARKARLKAEGKSAYQRQT